MEILSAAYRKNVVWSVDTFSFTSLLNICIKWCDHEYTGMSDKRIMIEWPTFVFASRAQAVTDNRVCTCDCHPMTLVNTCRKRYHVTVTMFWHHGVATSNLKRGKEQLRVNCLSWNTQHSQSFLSGWQCSTFTYKMSHSLTSLSWESESRL